MLRDRRRESLAEDDPVLHLQDLPDDTVVGACFCVYWQVDQIHSEMSMQLCFVLTRFLVCLKMLTRPDDHKARTGSDISRVRCAHGIA